MAEAARRARAAGGGTLGPPTVPLRRSPDPPVDDREPDSAIPAAPLPDAPDAPDAPAAIAPPPEAAPPAATTPTERHPAPPSDPPSPSPPAPPVAPVMVFDALAEERTGAGPSSLGPPGGGSPTPGPGLAPAPTRHRHTAPRAADPDRGLRRAILGVSVALVAVLVALLGSVLFGSGPPPVTSDSHPPTTRVSRAPSPAPSSATPTTPDPGAATSPSSTSSTTTSVPVSSTTSVPGGAPALTSLQPSSGAVGQAVVVTGAGFYSPSGHIRATVGGQTAFVSCSNQATCTVTIPPLTPVSPTEPVVIITDSGPSNPLSLTVT